MNIGQAAECASLPTKTIRYYEEIGLVRPMRRDNGYRAYTDTDVHKLIFLQRARRLGFTIEECRQLLSLYEDRHRASADVKAVAERHLADVEAKLGELQALRTTLKTLVRSCKGDERPDCPILETLASESDG